QKALADERIAKKALDRAQLLFDRGAVAEKDLQVAQNAEEKARVDVTTSEQKVRVMGGDPARPSPLLELRAPVSGTIVEQNVAGFEGVKSLDNTPNLFTIADLSQVWVFRKEGSNRFRRVEVHVSGGAADGMQEVREGLKADDEVVLKALDFSTAVAEKKE